MKNYKIVYLYKDFGFKVRNLSFRNKLFASNNINLGLSWQVLTM